MDETEQLYEKRSFSYPITYEISASEAYCLIYEFRDSWIPPYPQSIGNLQQTINHWLEHRAPGVTVRVVSDCNIVRRLRHMLAHKKDPCDA